MMRTIVTVTTYSRRALSLRSCRCSKGPESNRYRKHALHAGNFLLLLRQQQVPTCLSDDHAQRLRGRTRYCGNHRCIGDTQTTHAVHTQLIVHHAFPPAYVLSWGTLLGWHFHPARTASVEIRVRHHARKEFKPLLRVGIRKQRPGEHLQGPKPGFSLDLPLHQGTRRAQAAAQHLDIAGVFQIAWVCQIAQKYHP
jgi:hypothetical protein